MLCLHFVTRSNPCHLNRRQCIHCLIVITDMGMTVYAAQPMRINEQMEMWIVTVVWFLDQNVRTWTRCYSSTSWTMLTQQKWNNTASLLINNRQFCVICHSKVCPYGRTRPKLTSPHPDGHDKPPF